MSSTTLLFPHSNRYALQPYLPPVIPANSYLPHLTLTYAQSLDGMISLKRGVQTALSGSESKAMTHYLRSKHDAILIGSATAYIDDPSLNCRFGEALESGPVGLESQPIPVILDSHQAWKPSTSKIIALAREKKGKPPLWLVVNKTTVIEAHEQAVRDVGGEVIRISEFTAGNHSSTSTRMHWNAVLEALTNRGIKSVMVEGGAQIITGLYTPENRDFISSVIITIAPKYLGVGGITICPDKTQQDKAEVEFKDIMWLPLGQDSIMAARLQPQIPGGNNQNQDDARAIK